MIDGFGSTVGSTPAADILSQELLHLRRWLAPSGTIRHRLLRFCYTPLIGYLQRRNLAERLRHSPGPSIVAAQSLKKRAETWPTRPRILVLKLDHIGDFVVALPAFAHIRKAFPDAVITLVCANWTRAWAENCGLFDTIVYFDFFAVTKSEFKGISQAHFDRFSSLDLGSFEVAIDLRHDPDTRPLLALVNADVRIGFAAPVEAGGQCMDIALPDMEHVSAAAGTGKPVHAELRLNLLAAALIDTFAAEAHPIRTLVGRPANLLTHRPFAILAPGAGSPIRIWPIRRLAAVGRALIERHGFDIVLIGSDLQRDDCMAISRSLPANRVHNLAGQSSIGDLPSIIDRAEIVVGYDSGVSHIAASLGVPTVAVMGSIGNPEVWRIDGLNAIALTTEIECGSCYLDDASECPFGVRCLTEITVDDVVKACESVLATSAACSRTENAPKCA